MISEGMHVPYTDSRGKNTEKYKGWNRICQKSHSCVKNLVRPMSGRRSVYTSLH